MARPYLSVVKGHSVIYFLERMQQGTHNAPNEVPRHVESLRGFSDEIAGVDVVLAHSLVGGSLSNGAVENAIKRLQGQLGTLKLVAGGHMKRGLDIEPNVWHWMVEFVADTCGRH